MKIISAIDAPCIIKNGGVIAYPTEAVYGLGCDPLNIDALKKIISIKERAWEKGLILVASNIDQILPFIDLNKINNKTWLHVLKSWDLSKTIRATTWVFPSQSDLPHLLTGKHNSIAIRVSSHPVIQSICNSYKGAIVSTSANISTKPAAVTIEVLIEQFVDKIDAIVEGNLGINNQPSLIIDVLTNKILRG